MSYRPLIPLTSQVSRGQYTLCAHLVWRHNQSYDVTARALVMTCHRPVISRNKGACEHRNHYRNGNWLASFVTSEYQAMAGSARQGAPVVVPFAKTKLHKNRLKLLKYICIWYSKFTTVSFTRSWELTFFNLLRRYSKFLCEIFWGHFFLFPRHRWKFCWFFLVYFVS